MENLWISRYQNNVIILISTEVFQLFFNATLCQEFRTSNDEEAAVLAASRAASTVIDAANAVEVSRLVISH